MFVYTFNICTRILHDRPGGSQIYSSRYLNQESDYVLLPSIFCVVKKQPVMIQNNIVVFVPRYPPKNRLLPPGSILTPVWQPLLSIMWFSLVNKLNMQRYVRSTADLTALQWWSGKGGTDCLCLLSGWLSHCEMLYKVSCWARKMQLISMEFVYCH